MNIETIREHVIESLSDVRGDPRADIDLEVERHGGDLRVDSKEGEAICALVEDALDLGELIEPADLKPEQLTSIDSLTQLIHERLVTRDRSEKDAA